MPSSLSGIVHIVDDDEAVRDSTIALLKAAGLVSRPYASGDAFLRDFDGSAGGCILLDLHMPGFSGFQVLDGLRERGNKMPVVLFSGRTDATIEDLFRISGATALLPKPTAPTALIGLVRQMLAKNGKNQAARASPLSTAPGP